MFSFLLRWFPAGAPLLAPALDYPFSRTDVSMLQQLTGAAPQIDEQTWQDLLLDQYSERLAQQTSILGSRNCTAASRAGAPCWRASNALMP